MKGLEVGLVTEYFRMGNVELANNLLIAIVLGRGGPGAAACLVRQQVRRNRFPRDREAIPVTEDGKIGVHGTETEGFSGKGHGAGDVLVCGYVQLTEAAGDVRH